MRITCINGYFIFKETLPSEVSKFIGYTKLDLVRVDDYFTFKPLALAPEFSISSMPYLNLVANKTSEGKPWDVFKSNGFCYDFRTGQIVDINLVQAKSNVKSAGNYLVSNGLILPGSINENGQKITSYVCWYFKNDNTWVYPEVSYG